MFDATEIRVKCWRIVDVVRIGWVSDWRVKWNETENQPLTKFKGESEIMEAKMFACLQTKRKKSAYAQKLCQVCAELKSKTTETVTNYLPKNGNVEQTC